MPRKEFTSQVTLLTNPINRIHGESAQTLHDVDLSPSRGSYLHEFNKLPQLKRLLR